MDVRQLAAIVAVADHGTFSSAARALYTVQSNVSGHIAKLERELGVTLIDRANGGLTEEGGRVVERARRILHEIDDIAADIASLDNDVSGDARIGVIGTTARWLMPQLLSAVAARHPRVHPIVSEGSTTTIVPGVLSGQLNAAIIHLPIDDPELEVEPLFAEDLLLLVHSAHPLAERQTMSLRELDDVPLLLPPKGAALRRVLDRAAASADVTVRARPPPPSHASSSTWCAPTRTSSPACTSVASCCRSSAPSELRPHSGRASTVLAWRSTKSICEPAYRPRSRRGCGPWAGAASPGSSSTRRTPASP